MSRVVVFVLDTCQGVPAENLSVCLDKRLGEVWDQVGAGVTDGDGCVPAISAAAGLSVGRYRLRYDVAAYMDRESNAAIESRIVPDGNESAFPITDRASSRSTVTSASLYPNIQIDFEIIGEDEEVVLPLLLSPFGYTTYRGTI